MGKSVRKDLPQSVLITRTITELDNDVVGLVVLRIGHNLETDKIVGTACARANQIVVFASRVYNLHVRHVGIPLTNAQTCSAYKPLVNRIGRIVLSPEQQIRVINVMPDSKAPPIFADCLSNLEALVLAVVVDVQRSTIWTCAHGVRPFSADSAPVEPRSGQWPVGIN